VLIRKEEGRSGGDEPKTQIGLCSVLHRIVVNQRWRPEEKWCHLEEVAGVGVYI